MALQMMMPNLKSLSLLLIFCMISSKLSYCNICPEIEKEVLLNFKESLKDPSNMLSSWNSSVDVNCCNWKGVVCDSITDHVRQLHLQFSGLGGKIDPSLLHLKNLRYLDLSQNNFEQTIPSFIGSLTSLEYLNLSHAGFYGTVPHSIGNLSNIHTLNLEINYYGSQLDVSSLEWVSELSQLEQLNMNSVSLSRAANWLQVINTLPSLVELHFSHCSLNFMASLSDINNVTSLTNLDLSGNNFQPNLTIPKWIFQLSNLIYLDLSDNFFEGPIPSITNYTTKLKHIDLSLNQFNSTISDWLYSMKDLEFVSMGHNTIQGALEFLYLWKNQLFGNLTGQFGEFKSLKTLHLVGNLLSGSIPTNIGNITSLQRLVLAGNKFTGNLPESVGQLSNLEFISIRNNKLEGVVSESHFANLTKLEMLYGSDNNLTLIVSPNWIPPFKLTTLLLRSWNIGSQIPKCIDTQKNKIENLDLSSTGISRNVPIWMWDVQFLNLSHNQLHGNIPIVEISGYAQFVYLSYNVFNGALPRIAANVRELDLSSNSFSRGLSRFLCDTMTNETYSLQFLHLGGNQLSGEIPDCWMKWPLLTYLNLGNNKLPGTIPNSIGFLAELRSLNLRNNEISGQIPFSMRNCTKLVKIDLANNDLNGKIPTWMGTSLVNLWILILRSNKLSGEISSDLCRLNSLKILDVSDNGLYGIMPRCVGNFTSMATKRSLSGFGELDFEIYDMVFRESATVSTKGSEYQYDTILALVTNIDLSNNNLSGDIPNELTSLVELRSLNLSGNHFTGLIPQTIGYTKQLESLDLSRNSLSGEMPNSFRAMSTLNYLNVSYNHLTSRIPESTQLRGFDNSSFIGNDLCGFPLTRNCSFSGPNKREDNGSDDKSSSKIEWFYIFLSLR
ncbi:hypothetical protein ACP275_14G229600 [Erythranthe tilingii]